MSIPTITLVAAIGKNRELGKDGRLPWGRIPEDLAHFKEKTLGKPIIMGRKTFESLGIKKPLPNRTNIVITRQKDYQAPGAVVVASLDEAISAAEKENPEEIAIIGGGEIFKDAITRADKLYLTVIDASFDADVYFPDYSAFSNVVSAERHDNGQYRFAFLELDRALREG